MARSATTFKRGHRAMGGRPKGSLNKTTIEVREFARRLIEDPEYQAGLRRRVIDGKAPQMEMLLFKYAYGQPVERHEVNAEVRAASDTRPEQMGSALTSGSHLVINGGVVTKEGAERIRRLTTGLIDWANREGSKEKAAGELPPSVNPPDTPA
jgi:hypothetical protein